MANRNGLEIAAEKSRRLRETRRLDFGVCRGLPVNPLQESVDMKLIVSDGGFDGVGDGGNFGEIAYGQTFARRTSDDVVCWMFVCIGSLKTFGFNDFPNRIDSETLMWINLLAFPLNDGLGEIIRVDATREQLGRVVVLAFIIGN